MMMFRILVPLTAFAVAAVAMLPLRVAWAVAPASSDLGVRALEGTVWSGQAIGVSWGGVEFGDFHASVNLFDIVPSPLVRLNEGTGPVKAVSVRAGGGGLSIAELEARIPLSMLDSRLPRTSELRILDGRTELSGGGCTHASGHINMDPAPQLALPAVSGQLSCNAGVVLASIATQEGSRATIALAADLRAFPVVRDATPDLAQVLAALGFATAEAGAQ